MSGLLEVVDLVKKFPVARQASMVHAVDGVSFAVAEGETVGLVGESGCGKSTLTRLVTRLVDATSGQIRFAGDDVAAVPAARFAATPLRAKIQLIFQDPTDSLNPRFTAFDAIADPVKRLGRPSGAGEVAERVAWAADRVGLARELLGRFPHQLSGGQRTRVGVARGIALSPSLLVLDEPTSSLDVSVQALILKLLDELRSSIGVTYLFVSHNLNVVRLLCDRVLVMYLGVIVEEGAADLVFHRPRHPYTQALVSAIPEIDPRRRAEKMRLAGEPASPIDVRPDFCRFAPRCPRASQRCLGERPPMRAFAAGHQAACHHPVED